MSHLVFTYGTLKRQMSNSYLLRDSTFIAEGVTIPDCYSMYDGGFPYVVKDGISHIKGELYKVDDDTLKSLDMLEGVPSHYVRHETTVRVTVLDEVKDIDCIMYVASPSTQGYLKARNSRPIMVPNDANVLEWLR